MSGLTSDEIEQINRLVMPNINTKFDGVMFKIEGISQTMNRMADTMDNMQANMIQDHNDIIVLKTCAGINKDNSAIGLAFAAMGITLLVNFFQILWNYYTQNSNAG
ncbi:MAG: hypothetical protein ACYDEI_00145 [Erysipelotrichaceae bacterium]